MEKRGSIRDWCAFAFAIGIAITAWIEQVWALCGLMLIVGAMLLEAMLYDRKGSKRKDTKSKADDSGATDGSSAKDASSKE